MDMASSITELIGVYNADSTVVGEISYWINARLGRSHCSLCELTHGLFTVKSEWTTCERNLAVPFSTFHRDDAPADVLVAANGQFPVVLVRNENGLSIALSGPDLERFNGQTSQFTEWLQNFLRRI